MQKQHKYDFWGYFVASLLFGAVAIFGIQALPPWWIAPSLKLTVFHWFCLSCAICTCFTIIYAIYNLIYSFCHNDKPE